MWYRFQSCYKDYSDLNNSHFVVGNEFIIVPYLNTKQYKLFKLILCRTIDLPDLDNHYFYNFNDGSILDEENILEIIETEEIRRIVISGSIIPWTEIIG